MGAREWGRVGGLGVIIRMLDPGNVRRKLREVLALQEANPP